MSIFCPVLIVDEHQGATFVAFSPSSSTNEVGQSYLGGYLGAESCPFCVRQAIQYNYLGVYHFVTAFFMKEKSTRNKTIHVDMLPVETLYKQLCPNPIGIDEMKNFIVYGDSIKLIKNIPDKSIDLIVTDPPYNLSKQYGTTKFLSATNHDYEEWLNSWMGECARILKDDGSIYICCDWKSSTPVFNIMNKYFELKNRITWEREKGRGSVNNWKNNIEDIYFGVKNTKKYTFNVQDVKIKRKVIAPYKDIDGEAKDWFIENGIPYRMTHPSNIWTDITIPFWSMPENTTHPTQKPEKVIAKLIIASSLKGQIVFDPFVGSGTTAVVASKLGRDFIGIEKEKEYCVIAQHRLNLAQVDKSIQGYENGVFLERNTQKHKKDF